MGENVRDGALAAYLNEISGLPLISVEEENILVDKIAKMGRITIPLAPESGLPVKKISQLRCISTRTISLNTLSGHEDGTELADLTADEKRQLTLEEVGQKLKATRERIRPIQNSFLKEMKLELEPQDKPKRRTKK